MEYDIVEGNVVSVANSLKTYGAQLDDNGTVLEVFPSGTKGFNEPCARVLFDNVTLKFGSTEVVKSIAPYIKLKDITVVSKGMVKNIRMPVIKFDVKTKLNVCNETRDAAVKSVQAIKMLDSVSTELFEKIDAAFVSSGQGNTDFKTKFDDRRKKLKQNLKLKLADMSSIEKVVTAYRVIHGQRIEHEMPFDKKSLKADMKKTKKSLDLAVKMHRSNLKNNLITSDTIMGIPVTKLGAVFDKTGQILFLQKQIPKDRILAVKKPMLKDEYIGVELECITEFQDYNQLRQAFIEAKLERYVDVVPDGSLRGGRDGDGDSGERSGCTEVRVLCLNKDKEDILTRVCKVIKDNGGYVNKTCGTHVHFDMRKIDANKSFNNLVRIQSILKAAQPESRRNAEYCKNNTSNDMNSPNYNGSARYWTINPKSFAKHKTLEVRVHEGTLDAAGLCGWVDFIFAVAKADKLEKTFLKLHTLKEVVPNIPQSGLDYMSTRIAMFA